MNTLNIAGNFNPIAAPCFVEVDEYVPLRFRTYDKPIGASYLRIGNFATTLTELIIEPRSQILRGITLTSFELFDVWPQVGSATSSEGLPILQVDWEKNSRVDVKCDFHVSLRPGEMLLSWGDVGNLSAILVFGKTQFLIADSELRGVRFFDLTEKQTALLTTHAKMNFTRQP